MKRKCNWIKKNSKCHSAFFLGIRQNRTAAATRATHFSSENREPELQLEKEGRVKNQIKERRRESLLWILKFTGVEGHNLQCYISVIRRLVALKKSEKLVLLCICLSWYLLTFGSFWKLISNRKSLTGNDKRTYSSCIENSFFYFWMFVLGSIYYKVNTEMHAQTKWPGQRIRICELKSHPCIFHFFKKTSLEFP